MARSILSNWVGLLVTGVISAILTPILIHGLGDFHYGLWVLVASILDYYGLLDLGMRAALFRFVALFKGANERAALNQTFVSALSVTVGVGLSLLVVTLLLAGVLPNFFDLTGKAGQDFRWLVVLFGLSVAVTFPTRLFGTYLCALQHFDLYNLAAVSTAIVRAASLVAILHFGYGILGVGAVTLGVSLLALFLHWKLVRWADPQVSFLWWQANWMRIRELGSFGFYAFLNTVGDYLRFYTDAVVIAAILGISWVTLFSVAARLMEYFKSIVVALGSPLMGVMSKLEGQCRPSELRALFLRATKITALLSFFLASLLLLDGKALIRLWVGEALLPSYPLVLILTAGYTVDLAQHPCILVILARARHRALGWWSVAEGVANLLLSIYWAKRYGLMGVALGTAVPMLVVKIVVQPLYALQVVGLSVRDYVTRALLRPVAVCALFLMLCWLVPRAQAGEDFLLFLVTVGWQTGLFALLAGAIGLTASERQRLYSRGKDLLGFALRLARTRQKGMLLWGKR